ncbi:hypothetical protein D3C80_1773040 [compost metagenome]
MPTEKVYLVEDVGNAPGRVYACFASREDAERFADAVSYARGTHAVVVERSLYYGQPPVSGYNP